MKSGERMMELKQNVSSYVMSFTSEKCGVCHATQPRLKQIVCKYSIELIEIDITKDQLTSGQNRVFTVPTVLVFAQGHEVLRESRFIDLDRVEKALYYIQENGLPKNSSL
jgi:thiol-disulfide isomerase/thioredoxin